MVEARSAFRLRERYARQPDFCRLLKQPARKMPRLVEFFRQRLYFRFRELTHGFLQQLLFFRQFKVHRGSLPSGQILV